MVSASTILMGCQTNTKLSQSNQTSATTIDFSVADSSRNQAQFQAFSSQLNANNSIDLKEYSTELTEYYKQGNGTAMGKMLFNILPMYKQRLDSID